MNPVHKSSLSLRLITYFARFPDEELSSDDLKVKFGLTTNRVPEMVSTLVSSGWLKSETRPFQRGEGRHHWGRRTFFMAGPMLLKEIGADRHKS